MVVSKVNVNTNFLPRIYLASFLGTMNGSRAKGQRRLNTANTIIIGEENIYFIYLNGNYLISLIYLFVSLNW